MFQPMLQTNKKPHRFGWGAHAQMIELATQGGMDAESSYLNVGHAAKEIDFTDMWKAANKMCSKFIHPTALSVMVPESAYGTEARRIVDAFKEGAREGAGVARQIIEQFLLAQSVSAP